MNFPASGMAWCRQDPTSPAETTNAPNTTQQAQPVPTEPASAERVAPAEKTAPEGVSKSASKAATENVTKKKTEAGPASGTIKHHKHKPSSNGAPRKVVVREGGASEPASQIAPDLTPAEATQQRQISEQLLGSTNDQLKRLAARTLNQQQQETVVQINNYMNSAHSALKEGDVRRANILAEKAHLLAEDLARH